MRHIKFAAVLFASAILAGCGGGGGGGDQTTTKVKFSSLVSFGDSLSDVGTYAVGTVKALGGGKYTINSATNKIWIELMAAQLGQSAPCAAQTGLDGAAAQGFAVPVTEFVNCTAYAQGGARVTNPVGPGNKLLGGANAVLGQLTVPVATQIDRHLARNGGTFKGDEVVFVLAGGNDLFINIATLAPAAAVTAMGTAGAELAGYVNTKITGKGAKYVVVVNLPDVSLTPSAAANEILSPGSKALTNTMVTTFNSQLQQGLAGNANVLYVDAYTVSRDQFANPAQYGLTNVAAQACNTAAPSPNALGSSLVCTTANLNSGVVDKFEYADSVHPTPYGYQLLAQLVTAEMAKRGWL